MLVSYCTPLLALAIKLACPQVNPANTLALDTKKLAPPTAEQSLTLETLNGFRTIHGLAPVSMDGRLNASATLHADDMAKTRVLSHKESNGVTQDALQRAISFGYDKGVAELVASGQRSAPSAVVSFVDAPYHRRLLMKPGHLDFGCGSNTGFACFVLGGQAERGVVISPPHGSDGVPTSWDGREEPNPMRGSGCTPPYGYPVMIAAYGCESGLEFTSATMKSSEGVAVECVVRQPKNDSDAKDCVIVVPKRPLASRTVYTATVEFSVDGQSRTETWSFRTGASVEQPPRKKLKKG